MERILEEPQADFNASASLMSSAPRDAASVQLLEEPHGDFNASRTAASSMSDAAPAQLSGYTELCGGGSDALASSSKVCV